MSKKDLPGDSADSSEELDGDASVRVAEPTASGSGATSVDELDADSETDNVTDGGEEEKKNPLGFLGLSGTAQQVAEWLSVVVAIWVLLNGVGAISSGFKMAVGDQAKDLFSFAENPFVGLAIGILATALMQSSSTTTSITVGMVAGGLPVTIAIPILFGANMGTSVTSTLVAMGLSGNKKQFRRAFSMATVHDFFNLILILIFFTAEYFFHVLERLSGAIAHQVAGGSGGVVNSIFEAIGDGVELVTEPGVRLLEMIVAPLGDVWGGIALAVIGIVLILLVIGFIGNMLSHLMVGKAEQWLHNALGRGPFTGTLAGALITAVVQSSSTTTSLTVPLAASGKFEVRELFPFVVGANIGTTVTGLIAAFAASGVEAEAAMQTALVHALFNTLGAIIVLSIPFLREIPPTCSDKLAELAEKNKLYVLVYVGGVFFVIPLLAVLISNLF